MKQTIENAIIVIRPTRVEQLKMRFNTRDQAKFYIKQKKVASKQRSISLNSANLSKGDIMMQEAAAFDEAEEEYQDYEKEDTNFHDALETVKRQLSKVLKIKVLEQKYLSNYIFSDKDLVVVLGQDGLVANTAKYAIYNPIIGINPDTNRYDGILLHFGINNFMIGVNKVISGNYTKEKITMAKITLNDGQTMLAFNDFFIGINTHSSANYTIKFNGQEERHSSSGIIVSTGAGSTGWLSSLFNMANGFIQEFEHGDKIQFKAIDRESKYLMFVVREPFVSKTSQANIIVGKIEEGKPLKIESNMPEKGIIFSDGVHKDFLDFNSGTIAEINIAEQKAILVKP
ncbi:MAG: sugar kinase [Bacteroidota bacterium]|nr:sugar kinase [Bacteroidota bacterium]